MLKLHLILARQPRSKTNILVNALTALVDKFQIQHKRIVITLNLSSLLHVL